MPGSCVPQTTQIQCRLGGKLSMLTCLHQICDLLKRAWWAQILAILWLSLSAKKHGYFYNSANGVGTLSLSVTYADGTHIYDACFSQNVWVAFVVIDHKDECDHTKCLSLSCKSKKNPNIQPTRNTYYTNPFQQRPQLRHLQVCFRRCQARQGDPASDHGHSLLCSA